MNTTYTVISRWIQPLETWLSFKNKEDLSKMGKFYMQSQIAKELLKSTKSTLESYEVGIDKLLQQGYIVSAKNKDNSVFADEMNRLFEDLERVKQYWLKQLEE